MSLILTLNANIYVISAYKNNNVFPYVYNKTNNLELAKKYTDIIVKETDKKGMNPLLIARQIYTESRFKAKATNKKTHKYDIAVGAMQIKPYFWGRKLYKYKWLRYQLLASTNEFQDQIRHLKNIKYNIPIGVDIMSHLYKKHKDYRLALIGYYCGEGSDYFKECQTNETVLRKDKYVRSVIR